MYVGGWPGDPSWGSISSVLPYTVWKGGDDHLVESFYSGAKRNVDFFMRESTADGLIEFGYYGDWLMLEHTEKPQVVATAQIMATSHLVEMAAHLGKMADAAAYNVSLTKMKLAYHSKYWDSEAKSYIGGSQTANLKLSQFVNRQATIISIMLSSILCYPYRPPLGAKGPNQSVNQSVNQWGRPPPPPWPPWPPLPPLPRALAPLHPRPHRRRIAALHPGTLRR
jgi:hypothetical protein